MTGGADRGDIPGFIASRYITSRLVKEGAGVQTILGVAVEDGREVVIKRTRLGSVSSAVEMRLVHEAEVLSRLQGPDGEPYLIEHGSEDGWIWLAKRFHAGESLAHRMAHRTLTVDESLVVAASLLGQLIVVHDSGVIHRDIKPANVILSGSRARVEDAQLVDFGLARSSWLDPSLSEEAVGTARYCSPEGSGLIDSPEDERSDLYSLGATIYESITGTPPFPGSDVGSVLHAHLTQPVPDLSEAARGVPRALAEWTTRMLQKDPSLRYQRASAALVDIQAIRAGRQRGVADPTVVIGKHDRRSALTESGFIGRETELSTLKLQLDQAAAGNGGLVLLSGESGAGKSRLLEELTRQAQDRGALVLRGQGEDRTAQRPYAILSGVCDTVAAEIETDSHLGDRLRRELSDHSPALGDIAPSLGALIGTGRSGLMPEQYAEARAVSALCSLLDRVGSASRVALVVLDDCQWSQRFVARLLSQWTEETGRARYTLVVASFRSEEVGPDSPLQAIINCGRIQLSGLDGSDTRDMVSSMAGPIPESAMEAVLRLGDGNAFMTQAVLRGMVETGALIESEQGWVVEESALDEVQMSRKSALFLVKRLEILSPAARTLLRSAAILGKEVDLDLAVRLSSLPPGQVLPALDEVRSRRILWIDESSARVRFLHDRLRETVLDKATDVERSDLHLRAAVLLRDQPGASPFELAYHFDQAGRAEDAGIPALEAAETARGRHALEDAETYYLIARKGAVDPQTKARIADGLGEVASLAGRYGEAEDYFSQAALLTDDEMERAGLEGKLGEVAFRRGDQARARAKLESAIRNLGGWIPGSPLTFVLAVAWELFIQTLHTIIPALIGRRRDAATERDQLKLRFASRLAYVYWFRSGRIPCLWIHLREMNAAERFGLQAEMAQAYSEHAPVMTMIPWFARGIEYARRSLAIRRELNDTWGQGQSLNFYGVGLYGSSRYREAVAACEDSVRILSLTGDRWEINTGLWHLALTKYRLGEWRKARAIAQNLYRDALQIGDHTAIGVALSVWARCGGDGMPSDALRRASDAGNEDNQTAAELCLAEAILLIHSGDPAAAARLLQYGWAQVRKAGLRQEYCAPLLPWWATALRASLESTPADDPSRSATIRLNRKVARDALKLSNSYQNNLPHALREVAMIKARAGKIRKARRLLAKSVAIAKEQGAEWEAARSHAEAARIGAALGWAGAGAELNRASEELAAIEAVDEHSPGLGHHPTLSLADRFASLLEAGRVITSASTEAEVFDAVEHAARGLLRADRCFVVETDESGHIPDSTVTGQSLEGVSVTVIRQAATRGAVICENPRVTVDATDSLVLAGIRSLICAPIRRDGEIVACFYATHQDITGLFGKEEVQLATLISTLAGAALEHVEGSAAYFRTMIENAHDITAVVDLQGNLTYVSPSAARVLGYDTDDLIKDARDDFIHPHDLALLYSSFESAVSGSISQSSVELRVRHRDGSWRWMELSQSNHADDPRIRGIVLNLRDTTERRKAEQELARAAEQFRLAFDNAPTGMAMIGLREENVGVVLRVNSSLAKTLGFSREDIEGQQMEFLTHPDDYSADLLATKSMRSEGMDNHFAEKRYRHSDGHWVNMSVSMAVVRDEGGDADYVILQAVDVTDQREFEERLTHMALHDPLTGLPNRRLFLEQLNKALARSARHSSHVAVLYLDLDRFKVINDSFGHATGDQVLIETAARLKDLTRDSNCLARLGGDEFVVLVENLQEPGEAPAIAQRIEDALKLPMTVSAGLTVSVTTSIGITLARPGDVATALLRDADTALYRAKERGRACHEVFGDHLRLKALGRMRAERDLRAAIEDERLLLHYQPVLDLDTGQVVGTEALVRFRRGTNELVAPLEFIEVAEETGLIVPVGEWVLGHACHQLAEWQRQTGNEKLTMAVNVSPRQLVAEGFAEVVMAVVAESGIQPSTLVLEVTESALIESIDASRPCLDRLRVFGCRIGIDDFGTGYSSLAYLRRLPVDFLKVDKSFVKGIGTNREDEAIVETVLKLAEALGLGAIAEGVETVEQEQILRGYGCRRAQGYLFGRPVPAEEVRLG